MKRTVVVVDDFENTRWMIEFALRRVDCNVLKAENGKEALKFFNGREIGLLITDYNMPVMNGPHLIKEVRNMLKYKFIPALLVTSDPNELKNTEAREINNCLDTKTIST